MKIKLTAMIFVFTLNGCQTFRTPPPEKPSLPAAWLYQNTKITPAASKSHFFANDEDFWQSFGDPALPALLTLALKQNAQVKLGELQARLARIQASLAGLSRWPSTSLSLSAGVSRPFYHPGGIKPQTLRSASAAFSAGLPLDIWGKDAAVREAADLEASASESDTRAIRLAICSAVAEARWQIGFLNLIKSHARADVNDAQHILELTQTRVAAGAIGAGDSVFAQRALAEREIMLSQAEQTLTEARLAFNLIMGNAPQQAFDELQTLPESPLPQVQAGIPADILANRADVQAAELRLRASLAEADAVRLSFYPSFNLTASYGTLSPTLTQYFRDPIGALSATLALPFIQFNTARFSRQSAYLVYEANKVSFINTLYSALKDVEQALSARDRLAEQAQQRRQALSLSREVVNLTFIRWQQGSTDIQPWLEAKSAFRGAEIGFEQNVLERRRNVLALYRSLKGGGK